MTKFKNCPFCGAVPEPEPWYDEPYELYKLVIDHEPTCRLVDIDFEYTEKHTLYEKWQTRADDWQPIEHYKENDHELVLLELPDSTLRLCCFLEDAGFLVDGTEDEYITNAVKFMIVPQISTPPQETE